MVLDRKPDYAEAIATVDATEVRQVPTGALLARLGQDVTARLRRALRPLELGAQEFIVLKQLEAMGTASQAELAEAVHIDSSNLATLVAALCERSLMVRHRDEADRRRYVLELGPCGREAIHRGDAAIAAGEDELLSALDPAERAEFDALLRRVTDAAKICPSEVARACVGD